MAEPETEPEPVAEPEAEPDSANMAACKEAFEMQAQMAMGTVDPAMIAEMGVKFAGFFAEATKLTVRRARRCFAATGGPCPPLSRRRRHPCRAAPWAAPFP